MSRLSLLYSFRARLLLVLASLLVATLGVQYYLNLREERRVALTIARQEQALTASIALALESLPRKTEYLEDVDAEQPPPLRQEHPSVINVLVVREDGRVDDSLDPAYEPKTLEDGSYQYHHISETPLPRLVLAAGYASGEMGRLVHSRAWTGPPAAGESRAFLVRVPISSGFNYVVVVLGEAEVLCRTRRAQGKHLHRCPER